LTSVARKTMPMPAKLVFEAVPASEGLLQVGAEVVIRDDDGVGGRICQRGRAKAVDKSSAASVDTQ